MADVGAVATQANVNVGYGQQAIDLLRQGLTALEVLKKILADDKFEGKDGRQVAPSSMPKEMLRLIQAPMLPSGPVTARQDVVRAGKYSGRRTGSGSNGQSGSMQELAGKLFAALKAGDSVGGDARGRQSASMLVVKKLGGRNINNDRYIFINGTTIQIRSQSCGSLDLNLAYNYGDLTLVSVRCWAICRRRVRRRKKPCNMRRIVSGSHMRLAFLDYLVGDVGLLDEFAKAKAISPDDFDKQWKKKRILTV